MHAPSQHALARTTCLPSQLRVKSRRTHAIRAERRFNEGAAQVKRLINRDRESVPDLDKPAQFDVDSARRDGAPEDEPSSSSSSDSSSSAVDSSNGGELVPMKTAMKTSLARPSPFGEVAKKAPLSSQSPFGSTAKSGVQSPFGPSSGRPFMEPEGMSPDMEISPVEDVWWKQITLTQVVIVLTFVASISLMVGTFWVVWKMGAIRMNE